MFNATLRNMGAGPTGNAQDGIDAPGVTPPVGADGIRGWLSGIYSKLSGTLTVALSSSSPLDVSDRAARLLGHVTVDNTVPVTGTFFQVTQPVSLATNTPDVTDRAARLLGHVTVDVAPTTTVAGTVAASQSGAWTVTQQALTKGTQGANGVTTQDLKDAGRTAVVLSVTAVASIVTETAFTLNIWKAGVVTTGTSYTVTAGKTFRLQAVQFGCRFTTPSTTVTFASARFNLRSGSVVTSPLVYGDSKMAAANAPVPNSDLPVPDGLEFPAATVLSLWHADSATTLLLDAVLVGYEY